MRLRLEIAIVGEVGHHPEADLRAYISHLQFAHDQAQMLDCASAAVEPYPMKPAWPHKVTLFVQ
jgi:hypothetical protein